MRVFGIDPGSNITGYGIVEVKGSTTSHIENGGIHLPSSLQLPEKLSQIYRDISLLIEKFQPNAVAIENIFVAKNVASTMKLGQVRGVAILAATNAGIPITEYTPTQVKQALTGHGRAPKEQIQQMVKTMLKLPDIAFEDASDALAIALCHCQSHGLQNILKNYGCKTSIRRGRSR